MYNQVPHLTQDTTWKSDKNTNIAKKSQEVSPFPAGDHKAAMNRRENMSTALERSVKIFYWRAQTSFTAPTSPLILMWNKTYLGK